MIFNILKYFFIYFFFQASNGIVSEVFFQVLYGSNISDSQINTLTNKHIYIFITIGAVISLLIYIWMFKNKKESLWERCQFKKISLKNSFFVMLLSTGLAFLTSSFLLLSYDKFKSYERISETLMTGMYSSVEMICIFMLIPIFEEILFRGLIFNELKKHLSIIVSITLQAFIFTLAHGNVEQGIYTFIFAIGASIVYIWTGSIWSTIILHIEFNLMAGLVIPTSLYYTKQYISVYIVVGIMLLLLSLVTLYRIKHKKLNINVAIDESERNIQ